MVIDLDALAADEDENWVWAGANVIEPDHSLALITLSRGGSDAAVVREFDMHTGEFVVDGFEVPEAKTQISWEDEKTVLIGTDWGEDSLTESGYPRLVKRWRRGTPLEDAETLFSGARSDVIVAASRDRTPGFERTVLSRAVDFFNDEVYELRDGEFIRIDAPTDATVSMSSRLAVDRAAHRLAHRQPAGIGRGRCSPRTTTNSSRVQPISMSSSSPTSTPASTTTPGRRTSWSSSHSPMSSAGCRR